MIFTCGLCTKTKMGKYNLLKYVALDDDDIPSDFSMKICKPCSVAVARSEKDGKTQSRKEDEGTDRGTRSPTDYDVDLR